MRQPKSTFTRSRRSPRRRDMAPTPGQFVVIQRAISKTVRSFGHRLSPECVEDLVQDVFLRLWKSRAEDKLNCLPYVRRVAANVTIDLLRRQSAQKRRTRRTMRVDVEKVFWRASRTPEDVLIEREEARQLLEADYGLKRRVKWAIKQYAKAQIARTE